MKVINKYTVMILILMFQVFSFELKASQAHSFELIEYIIVTTQDTGDVLYLTQASPGIFETGSYAYPYVTLKRAMEEAEDGDNIVFLRGNLNTYDISEPLLLSKKVLITAEPDQIIRLGDDEPFLPIKGIPLIIN